jgi:hypothetical protein
MKKLLLAAVIATALFSCSPKGVYTYNSKLVQEDVKVDFESTREAKRVQKRISKHCSEPKRVRYRMWLNKEQLECCRIIFKKEHGFIREKYRSQIDEQLNP